jgi:hypothetical protein
MKALLILASCLLCSACYKTPADPAETFKNNVISIKVVSAKGDSSQYTFEGMKAPMYIASGILSSPRFQARGMTIDDERQIVFGVDGTDSTNTKIVCGYYPIGKGLSYFTSGLPDEGFITFTTYTDNLAEGYFEATCRAPSDSVLIKGSFRGHYNK